MSAHSWLAAAQDGQRACAHCSLAASAGVQRPHPDPRPLVCAQLPTALTLLRADLSLSPRRLSRELEQKEREEKEREREERRRQVGGALAGGCVSVGRLRGPLPVPMPLAALPPHVHSILLTQRCSLTPVCPECTYSRPDTTHTPLPVPCWTATCSRIACSH